MHSQLKHQQNEDGGPWYKQFWAWFVFTPLIIVIIACSFTVTIAFKGKEDTVVDNYYKTGRMINQEFESEKRATELGLVADVSVAENGNSILVHLNKTEWLPQESLVLSLSHPVQATKDQFITLIQVDTLTWQAELKSKLSGRWYLRLSAIDDSGIEEWRVQGEIQLSEALATQLK